MHPTNPYQYINVGILSCVLMLAVVFARTVIA